MAKLRTECDGSRCKETVGLALYRVIHTKYDTDWGPFTYCPKCAELDRKIGFTLEPIEETPNDQ